MKSKLFEQVIDWEEVDQIPVITDPQITVPQKPKEVLPLPVKNKIIKKDKGTGDKKKTDKPFIDPKIHNDDPQTTLGKHLAQNKKLIDKLIINAIYFNREIAIATKKFDIDEMAVYRLCTKRLSSPAHACYVDVILRLIYPNANMQKLIAKNKAAYEYFFTRNYSTITLKSQRFQEIDPENTSNGVVVRGINQLFNNKTKPGNWFDWDSTYGIKSLNNLSGGGAAFKIADSKNNKFILNINFTDSQIHERVMIIYREMIFGKPRNYIGKSAEYDRDRNKTN